MPRVVLDLVYYQVVVPYVRQLRADLRELFVLATNDDESFMASVDASFALVKEAPTNDGLGALVECVKTLYQMGVYIQRYRMNKLSECGKFFENPQPFTDWTKQVQSVMDQLFQEAN